MVQNIFSINKSFLEYAKDKGYLYNSQSIENYLLSLKVNQFVILTGESGTGKTKLPQLFGEFISQYGGSNVIETEIKVGKTGKNRMSILPRDAVSQILPIDKYESECSVFIDDIEVEGKLKLLFRINWGKNDDLRQYLIGLGEDDPSQYVNLKMAFPRDGSEHYKMIFVNELEDIRDIFLDFNLKTEEYEKNKALELIENAARDYNVPYFLILDEINLTNSSNYIKKILLAIDNDIAILNDLDNSDNLMISGNLFIVGTVNSDGGNCTFSPKILERANIIELCNVPVKEYMLYSDDVCYLKGDLSYLMNPLSDLDVCNMTINELKLIFDDIYSYDTLLWDVLSFELDQIQKIIQKAGLDLSFRVVNDIIKFMVVSWKYEGSPKNWKNWRRYFDAQIKQRILPKLQGSGEDLNSVISDLFSFCLFGGASDVDITKFKVDKFNSKFYTSAIKLKQMEKNLSKHNYSSFIK